MSPLLQLLIIALSVVFLAFVPQANAEFKLETLQTSGCRTNAVSTATFSTAFSTVIGDVELSKGSYWEQGGAVWEFSTNTEGIIFSDPLVQGYVKGLVKDRPQEVQDAFRLNRDRRTITFTVPYPTFQEQFAVSWEAKTAITAKSSKVSPTVDYIEASPTTETYKATSTSWYEKDSFLTQSTRNPYLSRVKQALSISNSDFKPSGASSFTWAAGACTMSTFFDISITCNGRLQPPIVPTATVCACPYGITLNPWPINPACGFTAVQTDRTVVPNHCLPSNEPMNKGYERTSIQRPLNPAHPMITHAPRTSLIPAKFQQEKPKADLELHAEVYGFSPGEAAENPLSPRQVASRVNITIKGVYACLYDINPPEPTRTEPAYTPNPSLAFLCDDVHLTPSAEAWTAFQVSEYMSNLINAPSPKPTPAAPLYGGKLIKDDVNPPGAQVPKLGISISPIHCRDVKGSTTGSLISIQRYLGYTAVTNFNNYLYYIQKGIQEGAQSAANRVGAIVKQFYMVPKPDPKIAQFFTVIAPIFAMMSGALAAFWEFSGPFSVIAGALAEGAGAGLLAALEPVEDKRWDLFAEDQETINKYIAAMNGTLDAAFNHVLGPNTSRSAWTGGKDTSGLQESGVFVDGLFASNETLNATSAVSGNIIRVFAYQAINLAWINNNCFILYVPYGTPVKLPHGKMRKEGIDEKWCNENLKRRKWLGKLTLCDANNGMAQLYGQKAGPPDYFSPPKGYDDNFVVVENETFSAAGAIRGSIASWREGGFGYNTSNLYKDIANFSNFSEEQLHRIASLEFREHSAGFFNIPVCQVFDLRNFPPLSNDTQCLECENAGAVGGKEGSVERFWSHVPDGVKDAISNSNVNKRCSNVKTGVRDCKCPLGSDIYKGEIVQRSEKKRKEEEKKRKEEEKKRKEEEKKKKEEEKKRKEEENKKKEEENKKKAEAQRTYVYGADPKNKSSGWKKKHPDRHFMAGGGAAGA